MQMKQELRIERMERDQAEDSLDNVEAMKIIYEDGSYDCVIKDSDGVKANKAFMAGQDIYCTGSVPLNIFPFNMEMPKKCETFVSEYDSKGLLTGRFWVTIEIEFKEMEDITVTAGKFKDCAKFLIVKVGIYDNGNFWQEASITHFAKNVGKVKEIKKTISYDAEKGEISAVQYSFELKKAIIGGIVYGKKDQILNIKEKARYF